MTFPKEIISIGRTLHAAGFEAYLVGGCLRDLLLGRDPKDWDIATNAYPDLVQKLFPDSIYENDFGTVDVKTDSDLPALKVVEVTTYRREGKYSDRRHPDEINFTDSIFEDLSRRDFTINALALAIPPSNRIKKHELIDPFGGQADLDRRLLRTVGDPAVRFSEDALRLLRAVRLVTELDFIIVPDTLQALIEKSASLSNIAAERIRDEFIKIIMTPRAATGLRLLAETKLLKVILPELAEGIGCAQNKHHLYDVFEHSVRALAYAAEKKYSLSVRLAALFHDVGKPRTKRGVGDNSTFYAHEIVGARLVRRLLERLRFNADLINNVVHLVRYHMFNYNVGEVSPAGVRRLLARVGLDYIDDLIRVREADRIGSGVPKAKPYKLRHLLFMIDKVRRDPVSPKMLKIDGHRLMALLNLKPSPRVGMILHALLDEVLDDPKCNTASYLESRAVVLNQLSDSELNFLMAQSKARQESFERAVEADMKGRHYVK